MQHPFRSPPGALPRHRLDGTIGMGPDGAVLRVIPERLGAHALAARCLQVPVGSRRAVLRRDAEVVARLGEPGLALVADVVPVDDDTVAIVGEIATGGSLADRLCRGPLPLDEAVAVVLAVARALSAAHHAGLTHRGLHAGNVLFGTDGPVVADLVQANAVERPSRAPDPVAGDLVDLARLALDLPDLTDRRAERYVAVCRAGLDGAIGTVEGFADALRQIRTDPSSPGSARTPPAVVPPSAARQRSLPRSSRLGAVAAGAVVVGACLGSLATLAPAAGRDSAAPRPGRTPQRVAADPSGWSAEAAELTVPTEDGPVRYRIGEPGDHLLIGDWDCDGTETPAVHRPSTGETFLFDSWAGDDAVVAVPGDVLVIGAEATVRTDGSCDRIVAAGTRAS